MSFITERKYITNTTVIWTASRDRLKCINICLQNKVVLRTKLLFKVSITVFQKMEEFSYSLYWWILHGDCVRRKIKMCFRQKPVFSSKLIVIYMSSKRLQFT